jgi:hypothetical protein
MLGYVQGVDAGLNIPRVAPTPIELFRPRAIRRQSEPVEVHCCRRFAAVSVPRVATSFEVLDATRGILSDSWNTLHEDQPEAEASIPRTTCTRLLKVVRSTSFVLWHPFAQLVGAAEPVARPCFTAIASLTK